MKLVQFRVQNYRNILDTGPIDVGKVAAFVGQNEAGKSNLFVWHYAWRRKLIARTYGGHRAFAWSNWRFERHVGQSPSSHC